MVVKLRTSLVGWPFGPGVNRQATTSFLCTSSPQQRGYMTSIARSFRKAEPSPVLRRTEILLCVLTRKRARQSVVPRAAPRSNFQASSGAPDPGRPYDGGSALLPYHSDAPPGAIPFSSVVVS